MGTFNAFMGTFNAFRCTLNSIVVQDRLNVQLSFQTFNSTLIVLYMYTVSTVELISVQYIHTRIYEYANTLKPLLSKVGH